jgi:hypothetical protein
MVDHLSEDPAPLDVIGLGECNRKVLYRPALFHGRHKQGERAEPTADRAKDPKWQASSEGQEKAEREVEKVMSEATGSFSHGGSV